MSWLKNLKAWYHWGHWLNTPQGVCTLLSIPVCWSAALVSLLLPDESRPLFLSEGPALFLITPLLAFVHFVRFGQLGDKQFSSSVLTTLVVLVVTGIPFYFPYLRSNGL